MSLLFLALSAGLQAQTIGGSMQEEPSKIHATVRDAIYLIRQDYHIRDTTDPTRKPLGLDRKPFFGRFYYLALNVEGNLITDVSIRTPWVQDPNFSLVKDSAKYVPELGASAYRRLSDTGFHSLGLRLSDTLEAGIELKDSLLTLIPMPSERGLRADTFQESRTDSAMWFWTLKAKGQQPDRMYVCFDTVPSVGYEVQKGRYSPSAGGYVTKGYYTSSSAIGGLVLSTHPSLGRMDFLVHGFIVRKPKGRFEFKRIKASRSTRTVKPRTTPSPDAKPTRKAEITAIEDID